MQLNDGLSDIVPDNVMATLPKLHQAPKCLPPVEARALGQRLVLGVTSDTHLRDDSLWRLRAIYEPALASQTLAQSGVALDIGAGFGAFALTFAKANPGWTVWAFEPEAEAFAALAQNLRDLAIENVIAVNAAVTAAEPGQKIAGISSALLSLAEPGEADPKAMAAFLGSLPLQCFRRHRDMRNVIELGAPTSADFEEVRFPSVPAEALLALQPSLLKLLAPHAETDILHGLLEARIDHLIGESWTHIPSLLIHGEAAGRRETWLPRAGDPLLRLRRAPNLNGHRPGLEIVVAMHNSQSFIADCVDSLLSCGNPDIRVLVVDDGSTDSSAEIVAARYAGDPRVLLLRKENGGCASARNFGRMHSDASHIAFVDADDMAGPGLFDGLLDLARHTGAEIVQGGFETFTQSDPGSEILREASYEVNLPEIQHAHRHPLGDSTCLLVPSWLLTLGQPSIWRRVYRRDYLDNRNIWFPEHIRAFDDQIFQLLTLQHVANVPMLDGVSYLYRQHPAQDIRQGDERHFYSLEMFRMALKRGISEGWNDFQPVLLSFQRTVNWCWSNLRADLKPEFERGAAELWVMARHALDERSFADISDDKFAPPDFAFRSRHYADKLRHLERNYGHVYLDSIRMHPCLVRLLTR